MSRVHPLFALAQQHLHHPTISFYPDAEVMRLAAIYTGIGLDHLGGEQPVALVHEGDVAETAGAIMGFVDDNWKADHFVGALLTTRRFILGNLDPVVFPLEGVHGARVVTGLLGGGLELAGVDEHGRRLSKKEDLEGKEPLAAFFNALVQLPPHARVVVPETTELAFAGPDDPTGARRALATPRADARVTTLLHVVEAAARQGMPAEQGLDLVRRVELFDRNERHGRGQMHGFWLSPLAADDLEHVAHLELQTCTARHVDPQGVLQLEFRWNSSLVRAAASSAVGEASVAVFGLGWYEVPTSTLTTVRLMRLPSIVGFQLRACSGDRFTVMPRGDDMGFVQDLHDAISWHEGRALLLRALFGWSLPLAQLQHAPYAELQQRTHQLTGQHDLAPFWPAPLMDDAE
jgi:hypothetical protein